MLPFRACLSEEMYKNMFLFFLPLEVNLGSFTKFGNSNIPTSVDSKFMQITTQQAPTECSAQTDTFSATRLPKEIGKNQDFANFNISKVAPMICRLYFLQKCLISYYQNIDNIAVCSLDEQWV